MVRFTRQMATYQDSYVDIRKALKSLAATSGDSALSASLARVRERVNDGSTLHQAYAVEGNRFPPILIRMTKVGEESGALAEIYRHLADYFELQLTIRRGFISALFLPGLQIGALIFVHSILSAFFAAFSTTSGAMSWSELERIFITTLLTDLSLIALLVGAILLARRYIWGKRFTDYFIMLVPGIRTPFRKLMLHRFSLSMYLMTTSAIGFPEAIRESARAANNAWLEGKLARAPHAIEEGAELSAALSGAGVFSAEFNDMMQVAEESGTVAETFRRLATRYGEDAETSMKRFASLVGKSIYIITSIILIIYIFKLFLRTYGPILSGTY